MKFSDRMRMSEAFEQWAEKNGAACSTFSVITWLDIIGALYEHNAKAYLAEEAGELKPFELPPCPICGAKMDEEGERNG